MRYLLSSSEVPVEHLDVARWNNRNFTELDYYKHLLPLVLNTDKVLQSFVAINFISAEEQENITNYLQKDRRTVKFVNFLIDKFSDDWSAVIAALQKSQQYQVSQIILKIQTIITKLKGSNGSSLSTKTLLDLKVRLNTDVQCNEQITELNLFNWSTAVNFQHNQITSISDYSRRTIIGELNMTTIIMNNTMIIFYFDWQVCINLNLYLIFVDDY